ncbi:DUF1735 domain-containing protein [Flammeovirga aprica]|uniref:DUF1735 domain-containing protein n=1 Tax=Flammeovirga aprica JL-4 TaxID=694437 RepID=A0A7X9RYC5_9BACT|nr:DUF1735 domain-containing protein [Flammeovirga aprica]NME71028.1 DUF1735 domain-containing protein [Flammeovirga aprica JL-4]
MKKILNYILAVVLFSSCSYDDYLKDFDTTTVYFSFQNPIRTLIVDEYEYIKLGVALGGKRENKQNEWAKFEVDSELLQNTPFKLLPSDVYTLNNTEEIVIPEGKMQGDVTVNFDMNKLTSMSEPYTNYALPVRITSTSLDQVHAEKDYTIIAFKYIAHLDGTWYHKGATKAINLNTDSTWTRIYFKPTLEKNQSWTLNTKTSQMVETNGISYLSGKMEIDQQADEIFITAEDEENFHSKSASMSADKKELYLSYSFQRDSIVYEATDTLIFATRNIVFETW